MLIIRNMRIHEDQLCNVLLQLAKTALKPFILS